MGNSFFPNVSLTADIYWGAQPPAVRALRNLHSGNERDIKVQAMAQSGYLIDVPVMVSN